MALLQHRPPRLVAAAGIVATVLGTTATVVLLAHPFGAAASAADTAGLPTGPITAAFVDSRPDAHLVYPGATVLKTVVNPEGPTACSIDGCSADQAYVDVWTATAASAATVRDWYKAEVVAQGYGCIGSGGPDYAYQTDSYSLGSREHLLVIYVDRDHYNVSFLQGVPADRTVVETQYSISETRYATLAPRAPAMCSRPLPLQTPSPAA